MKPKMFIAAAPALFIALAAQAQAAVSLGTSANFGVLAGTTITNTGNTEVIGNIGVYSGTAITGFFGTNENDGPGTFSGTSHQGDAVAQQAQADALAAYNNLEGMAFTQDLTGQDLGVDVLTLSPGVYKFDDTAQLTGTLVLDGAGEYIFQIGSTLTTASGASISFINGADPFSDVFWQVGSSATLGTGTEFGGTIIALTSNTLTTGANVDGRIISLNGAVTLDNNNIAVPEPAALSLAVLGGLALIRRRRAV